MLRLFQSSNIFLLYFSSSIPRYKPFHSRLQRVCLHSPSPRAHPTVKEAKAHALLLTWLTGALRPYFIPAPHLQADFISRCQCPLDEVSYDSCPDQFCLSG